MDNNCLYTDDTIENFEKECQMLSSYFELTNFKPLKVSIYTRIKHQYKRIKLTIARAIAYPIVLQQLEQK